MSAYKLIVITVLAFVFQYTKAQIQTFPNRLVFKNVPLGSEKDSLLVIGIDGSVRHVKNGLNKKINTAEKGIANGVATLDNNGKVPLSQLNDAIIGSVNYQGNYNASNNSPTLPPAVGNKGKYYVVSVAGNQQSLNLSTGDWIISNGTSWQKVDNNNLVTSVAGKVGAITLTKDDVGLSNVSNTPDGDKPVSNPTFFALATKANLDGTNATGYWPIDIKGTATLANQWAGQNFNSEPTTNFTSIMAFDPTSQNWRPTSQQLIAAGSAIIWGGKYADFDNFGGPISSLTALDNVNDGTVRKASSAQVASWIGLNNESTLDNNISGNASTASNSTTWNNQKYDSSEPSIPSYLLGLGVDGKWHPANSDKIKTLLGISSNIGNFDQITAKSVTVKDDMPQITFTDNAENPKGSITHTGDYMVFSNATAKGFQFDSPVYLTNLTSYSLNLPIQPAQIFSGDILIRDHISGDVNRIGLAGAPKQRDVLFFNGSNLAWESNLLRSYEMDGIISVPERIVLPTTNRQLTIIADHNASIILPDAVDTNTKGIKYIIRGSTSSAVVHILSSKVDQLESDNYGTFVSNYTNPGTSKSYTFQSDGNVWRRID